MFSSSTAAWSSIAATPLNNKTAARTIRYVPHHLFIFQIEEQAAVPLELPYLLIDLFLRDPEVLGQAGFAKKTCRFSIDQFPID